MLSRSRTAAAAAALGLLAWSGAAYAAVSYQDYHSFAQVEQQLQAWSKDHPQEVKLLTLGKSAGGRPIYAVRIAGPGADPDARPAVFVGANVAGYHNAGTEAALDLIQTLATAAAGSPAAKLLAATTFYVAPALNPDAHDGIFAKPRVRRGGNGQKVDHDVDGLVGEDGPDDLNGDGVITRMRIPDPTGGWLPDATDPRVLVKADSMERRAGAYRVESEGKDDDGDGDYNEDAADGIWPDRNFPHAFSISPESGPWPAYAPETRALLAFLFERKNVALAVVYGPANNLLAAPQSLGGGGDLGTQKFKVPPQAAKFLGFDPEQEYTLDQVWEVAQNLPFVRQNGITKEQLAQFLGAGPATKVDPDDQAFLDKLAEGYKERLKKAGLSADRPGAQYARGGFTPWLYYQYGAMALELDVWGIPKAEKKSDAKPGEEPLTPDKVATMTSDQFVALGKEKIEAFLKENKVPPQFSADMVIGAMKGGQITPKAMVDRMKQMGGGGGGAAAGSGKASEAGAREREVLSWLDANVPGAFTPWTPVTLPDGTKAEVGGLDPFAELNPPMAILKPALGAHTETVLDLAGKLAHVEILSLDVTPLGGGVYRVKAVAGNHGYLPSHTKQAARARAHIPVRLVLELGKGVELVTGYPAVTSERLEGTSGTLAGEWLVKAAPGTKIVVDLVTDNAGRDQKSTPAGKGA
ncbi:MAG TPA: M14 family zinc carboxypeptidase [Thermoanaerobaculia bacterium]|nr:M14 family zinc carboxypeptidase [Thermoanaerobaculia bacterium]